MRRKQNIWSGDTFRLYYAQVCFEEWKNNTHTEHTKRKRKGGNTDIGSHTTTTSVIPPMKHEQWAFSNLFQSFVDPFFHFLQLFSGERKREKAFKPEKISRFVSRFHSCLSFFLEPFLNLLCPHRYVHILLMKEEWVTHNRMGINSNTQNRWRERNKKRRGLVEREKRKKEKNNNNKLKSA